MGSASDAMVCGATRLFNRAHFTHFSLCFLPRDFCQTLRSRVLQAATARAVQTNKTAPQSIASGHASVRALALSQAHA